MKEKYLKELRDNVKNVGQLALNDEHLDFLGVCLDFIDDIDYMIRFLKREEEDD